MPKILFVIHVHNLCGLFATVTVLDALMYLKLKLLITFTPVVFFSYFKKFKCLGDILASVSFPQFALRSQL